MKRLSDRDQLILQSLDLIQGLNPVSVHLIGELLSGGEINGEATFADLGDKLQLPDMKVKSLKRLLNLAENLDGKELSTWVGICLLALSKQKELLSEQQGAPEIVTSGQSWIPSARDTRNVMLEMIRSAKTEILMLVFAATKGAKDIVEELANCAGRGVISFIVAEKKTDVVANITDMWPSGIAKPLIYLDNSGVVGRKVHGKVLVVDRKDLLVTSANLTHFGLDVNVEIGIRATGEMAQKVAEGIINLCKSRSMERLV